MKIKERPPQIRLLNSQFQNTRSFYSKAQGLFLEIQKTYAGQKELYLQSDEKLMSDLKHLAVLYDSAHIFFNDYKSTAGLLGKIGYNQDYDPQEIKDFKKDGVALVDFYHDDLHVWDYKRWALSSLEVIQKEIIPLKDQLVALDVEINQVHQKLKKDSVSVANEIMLLQKKIGFPELHKIDDQPLPVNVFRMKLAELSLGSQIVEDRPVKDSLDIPLQVGAIRKELVFARRLDSLAGILTNMNIENEVANYRHFISAAYGTPDVLRNLISATKGFAAREADRREKDLIKKVESLRWIINEGDSIPLFNEVAPSSRFKPLLLEEEKFTAGLQFVDTVATGYFYAITPSRKPVVKAVFPVDGRVFTRRSLPFTKALGTRDEKGLVYFVVVTSETRIKEKFPAAIARVNTSGGLAWSLHYEFVQLPGEINYSPDTDELSVRSKNAAGEVFAVIFDKSGKVVK